MTFLDWSICGGYLLLVAVQAWWFAGRQDSNEEYFVGRRRMGWPIVGVSLFATNFSALSFVGLLREAVYEDYHLLLAKFLVPVIVVPVVSWVFIPVFQRLQLISAYEYLERRFDRRVRLCGSFFFSAYTLGWMGTMLYASALLLQSSLDLSGAQLVWAVVLVGLFTTAYAAAGGVRAIIWTDVSQTLVLGGAVAAILFLAVNRIDGGLATVWSVGLEQGKLEMFDLRFDFAARSNFYSACAYGIFVYLAHHAVSQSYVQRYAATPDVPSARRALVLHGWMVAVISALFILLGTTIFVYYQVHPVSAGQPLPELAKQDQIATHFVRNALAFPGLLGLLLAGLFTAMMSSIDSGVNNLTAVATSDWLSGRDLSVRNSRLLCALFGAAAVVTALAVPVLGSNVFDVVMRLGGALFGPLLGLFALGVLSSRSNAPGALLGLLVGLLALAWAMQTDLSHWWYGAITSVSTVAAGLAASLAFPAPVSRDLEGLLFRPR